MAEYPAMPLWTDAYLADTMHLSEAEHGRYLLMLIHLWRMPRQQFPNDDNWLARKFGKTRDEIQTNFRPLIDEFLSTDGNWLYQKRQRREFEYLQEKSAKQRDRAKSRWAKEKALSRGNAERHMPMASNETTPDLPGDSKPTKTKANGLSRGNATTPTPTPLLHAASAGAKAPPKPADVLLYERGKALLGKNAGGQLTKLRTVCAGDAESALKVILLAEHKQDPAEYVAKVIKTHSNRNRRVDASALQAELERLQG